MSNHLCHLCDHPNELDARFCAACGVGLVVRCAHCGTVRRGGLALCGNCGEMDAEADEPIESTLAPKSAPAPVRRRMPPPGFEPSEWGGLPVLSLDDAVPVISAARGLSPAAAPKPIPLSLTDAFAPNLMSGPAIDYGPPSVNLRDMDHPEVWLMPDGEPLPPPPAPQHGIGAGLVRSDSFFTPLDDSFLDIDIPLDIGATTALHPSPAIDDAPRVPMKIDMPMALPVESPSPSPSPSKPFVDHRDAKAARRAAVRRARLASQAKGLPLEPMPTDILVVDNDDATRQRLCLLLDAFGFNVQSSRSTAHAVSLLASRVYLAVFADVDLQDSRPDGGIEVCRLTKEGGPLPDGRRPTLIMMSARASSAERVRAALAGSEQYLVKPLSRGHVARALEACDIHLPSDPRRAAVEAIDPSDPFGQREA